MNNMKDTTVDDWEDQGGASGRRGYGDIENDIGFVEGQIEDMENELVSLRKQRELLLQEQRDYSFRS